MGARLGTTDEIPLLVRSHLLAVSFHQFFLDLVGFTFLVRNDGVVIHLYLIINDGEEGVLLMWGACCFSDELLVVCIFFLNANDKLIATHTFNLGYRDLDCRIVFTHVRIMVIPCHVTRCFVREVYAS